MEARKGSGKEGKMKTRSNRKDARMKRAQGVLVNEAMLEFERTRLNTARQIFGYGRRATMREIDQARIIRRMYRFMY